MKLKIVRFGSPKDITSPGQRGRVIRFPFSKEEGQNTTQHTLDVAISDLKIPSWQKTYVDDAGLVKVLFAAGWKDLEEKLRQGDISDSVRFEILTSTHPGGCPFDPARIDYSDGKEIEIEIPSKIGFR